MIEDTNGKAIEAWAQAKEALRPRVGKIKSRQPANNCAVAYVPISIARASDFKRNSRMRVPGYFFHSLYGNTTLGF
jgi:hypothetical protein